MSGSGACRDNLNSHLDDIPDWCDDCHGYTHMPYCPSYEQLSHEQPASATVSKIEKQSDLFPRYSFAVVTGRYKILDNRSAGPVRITQLATADGEQEARTIVNALNADVQFLANRAEELSSLLAGMTTERDGLREALRRMCDKFYPHACNVNGPDRTCDRCSTLRQASAALNNPEQEGGSR